MVVYHQSFIYFYLTLHIEYLTKKKLGMLMKRAKKKELVYYIFNVLFSSITKLPLLHYAFEPKKS